MSAEQQLYAALAGSPEIVAAVKTRIFPDVAPEKYEAPMIVYSRLSSEPITTIHDNDPVASKVQMTAHAWATTRPAAEAIADLFGPATREFARQVNRLGHFDVDSKLFGALVDFEIWE